ncbi:MAG TPA: bifunctional oligoribonuclease/PAP phosphatase NrnA [Acidimicrobiales bacterium]|nr:bifunctional oligoribonuclease/PAP phosphatase NrnA [Acidimicrobiales bacterium]
MSTVAEVAEVLAGAPSLALACHHHPDGDALGSMLAMHLLCEANGKASVASWPSPWVVAPHYEFLPGLDRCVSPAEFPGDPDVLVTFDLGRVERLGDLAGSAARAREVVVLDHHPDNQRFGTRNLVDESAAATAVLVRQLATELGWSLTHDVALCLYVGLVTDTGRFRYPNTTPDVFHLAEELAEYQLPIARITRELFEKHRFQYVQLLSMALARTELDPELRFVVAWLTAQDLEDFDVSFDETEGFIDHVRACQEADVACVLRESPGEGLRVSLRSTGATDVSEIAARLGGGGHTFMAGFSSDRPIPEVIDEVRALLPAPTPR